MTRQLPSAPSLVNLKKQAKSILRAHRGRDVTCCEVLKLHHRFDGKTDEDILSSTVGLREVQHALARDYGFKGWAEMKNQVTGASVQDAQQRFWQVVAGEVEKGRNIGDAFREAAAAISGTPLARAAEAVSERGSSGTAVWQAMESYASEFSSVICILCRAAEASPRHWPAVAKRICEGLSDGVLGPDAPDKDHEQSAFWQVLGLCLSSGVPLLGMLDLLADRYLKSDDLKTAVRDIRSAVAGGRTIGDAMAEHTDIFPPTVISLIRDGERLGKLEKTARKAGEWLRNGSYQMDEDFLMEDSRAFAVVQMLKQAVERGAKEVVFDPSDSRVHDGGPGIPAFRPKFVMPDGSEELWKMWVLPKNIAEIERQLKAKTRLDAEQSGEVMTGTLQIELDGEASRFRISYQPQDSGTLIRVQCGAVADATEDRTPAPSPDDVQQFFEGCSVGLNSGLPFMKILSKAMDDAGSPAMAAVITEIGKEIESGKTFAEALADHPSVFNETCVAMIRTGQALGTLEDLVAQIANLRVAGW